MFGTLNVQPEVPLTFVENPDLSSALSRNRRDKPHHSCKLCKLRKIRCNGEPSGCDKCIAISAECQYPAKNSRRKKRPGSAVETGNEQDDLSQTRQHGSSHYTIAAGQDRPTSQHQVDGGWKPAGSVGDGGLDAAMDEWQDLRSCIDIDPGMLRHLDAFGDGRGIMNEPSSNPRFQGEDAFHNEFDFGTVSNGVPSPLGSQWNGMLPQDPNAAAADADCSCGSHARYGSPARKSHPRHASRGSQSTLAKPFQSPISPSCPHTRAKTATTGAPGARTPEDACRCLHLTVRLLEELGARSARNDAVAMDVLLGEFRDALSHVTGVLECRPCAHRTENNMLLAMCARYMSVLSEQMVDCYVGLQDARKRQHEPGSASSSSSGGWAGGVGGGGDSGTVSGNQACCEVADEMWFVTYKIKSRWERLHVLMALVTVQMADCSQVLHSLKARVSGQRGQMELLVEAENRVQAARSRLKDCIDTP